MGRVSDAKERLMKAVLELIWKGSYGTTTIDQICAKAGVKKGSFYYFFASKADLASAALLATAEGARPQLDAVFSPAVAPLERFRRYCEQVVARQSALKCECGRVLGCPTFTLGAEICTQEDKLRETVQGLLADYRKYFETAIRDAQAAGELPPGDPVSQARMLFAFYEGTMTQARIHNDPGLLHDLYAGTLAMLGAERRVAAAA